MTYGGVCLRSERMCKGVDTECCLMDKEHSTHTGINQSTPKVTPKQSCDGDRNNKSKCDCNRQVVSVLPHHKFVLVQVSDIDAARASGILLEYHPADVCIPKALVDCIRILEITTSRFVFSLAELFPFWSVEESYPPYQNRRSDDVHDGCATTNGSILRKLPHPSTREQFVSAMPHCSSCVTTNDDTRR